MSGFGGAGAFSDGKYNITNDFGGTLYEYIGKKAATELMEYVDTIKSCSGVADRDISPFCKHITTILLYHTEVLVTSAKCVIFPP